MSKDMPENIEDFRLENEGAAEAVLADDGFLEAFSAATALLGSCFLERPVPGGSAEALAVLRSMDLEADWPFGEPALLGRAAQLLQAGASEEERALDLEFQRLMRGTGRRTAPPFGSVYMDRDEVLYGWTWLKLRDWMRLHGLESRYEEKEPEDQFGRMLMLASMLAGSRPGLLPEFLGDHLLCWSDHFLELFLGDMRSLSYEALGLLARATLADAQGLLGIVPARRRFFR